MTSSPSCSAGSRRLWLAGLLTAASIMAAVMASDSRDPGASSDDVHRGRVHVAHGGPRGWRNGAGPDFQARLHWSCCSDRQPLIALRAPQDIFDLAVRCAFSVHGPRRLWSPRCSGTGARVGALAARCGCSRLHLHRARARALVVRAAASRPVAMTSPCALMVIVSLATPPSSRDRRRPSHGLTHRWSTIERIHAWQQDFSQMSQPTCNRFA